LGGLSVKILIFILVAVFGILCSANAQLEFQPIEFPPIEISPTEIEFPPVEIPPIEFTPIEIPESKSPPTETPECVDGWCVENSAPELFDMDSYVSDYLGVLGSTWGFYASGNNSFNNSKNRIVFFKKIDTI
jgi:hypothetical protein